MLSLSGMSNITHAATPTESPIVNAAKIAKFYGVSVPCIYRWAKEKKIPSIKFQDTVRFNFEAVRAVIEGKEAADIKKEENPIKDEAPRRLDPSKVRVVS